MIQTVDKTIQKKLTKNNSHLQFIRSEKVGGAGALMTLGVFIIGIAWLLTVFLFPNSNGEDNPLLPGIYGTIAGLVFLLPGILLQNTKIKKAYSYFEKNSGYSIEELQEFDQEFESGQALLVCPSKKLNKLGLRNSAVFTKNWVKRPFMSPGGGRGLYRAKDVAAAWYEGKKLYDEVENALIIIGSDAKLYVCHMSEQEAGEFICELLERNPKLITDRKFIDLSGHAIDALYDPNAAAKAYCEALRQG